MTLYRLKHRPDLGVYTSAIGAVLAGIAAGLSPEHLAWEATS